MAKAKRLAQEFIIVDTHIDAPERMIELKKEEDISVNSKGEFDYVKAKKCRSTFRRATSARAVQKRLLIR
jgi:hypothetical protein